MVHTTGSTPSTTLIARVRERDAEAWRRLTDLYGPLVFAWCRRQGLQSADASDVLQEVFTAVLAAIDRFRCDRPSDTFRGWLWTITRNKIHDHNRRLAARGERPVPNAVYEELADLKNEPGDDPSLSSELRELFHRGLELVRAEFEERTFQACWRGVVDGQSTADVAAELGMSMNNVRQAKSRVLRRLREELGDVLD